MIVVSGASGNLGRRTVQLLIQRIDASRVVALSRTPGQIADLGVETRFADFHDLGSLVRPFDSAERLLIISVGGNDRFAPQERAVGAAVRAGVGHVIFTSFTRAAEPGNPTVTSRISPPPRRFWPSAGCRSPCCASTSGLRH